MQDNLGLVQLLLDFGDAARLVGILILDDVLLQRWIWDLVILGLALDRSDRFLGEELVHELGEDTVGGNVRVVLGDDDASDTLGPGIAVYHVVLKAMVSNGPTGNGERHPWTHPVL